MKRGFTLIELLITMAITGILLVLVYINILKPQSSAALISATNTLVTDLSQQQLKSMVGETGNIEASPSGIYFENSSYTLFTGGSYTPNHPLNFVVNLPANTRFSEVRFPNSSIIFASGSGEVVNFSPTNNSVTLLWGGVENKQVVVNRYGVVTN